MDGHPGGSNALPPFLMKTYEMVEDPSTNSIVSWSDNNKSFVVWNPPEFARDLLPKFFKHNNFSSFIRQLNTYGFRKVDPEQWEFANDEFVRGHPNRMKNIHRRKPIHSHSVPNSQSHTNCSSLAKTARHEMKDEIHKLRRDKETLLFESRKHLDELHGVELQMQLLQERLQQRNQRQQDTVSFLARILQKPGLALKLLPWSQSHDRKRSLRLSGSVDSEIEVDRNWNAEPFEILEASVVFWESILKEFQQLSSVGSAAESTCCVDSLTITSNGIDINSEPPRYAGIEPGAIFSTEKSGGNKSADVGSAVNDVFWEQFLTEIPRSFEAPKIQLAETEASEKTKDGQKAEHGRLWWEARNASYDTGQIGRI